MVNIKKVLLGGLCVAFLTGNTSDLCAFEEGDWLIAPHIGGSPGRFNTPYGITVTVTDDPELPAPVQVVVPNIVEPSPMDPPPPPCPDCQGDDEDLPTVAVSNRGTANFNDMYKTPLVFGLDIGFMATSNLEVFFGYEFMRARGKKFLAYHSSVNNIHYLIKARLKSYDAHSGYVGVRHHFKYDSCFIPFVGVKLGGAQNKQGITHLTIESAGRIGARKAMNVPGFFNTIGFVGGPQIGFDYKVRDGISFYLAVEALYKTSHYADTRPGIYAGFTPTSPKLQAQVTQFGTSLWAFPFAFGMRITR